MKWSLVTGSDFGRSIKWAKQWRNPLNRHIKNSLDMSQLPPKRYQNYWDSKYDSIRHQPWFRNLEGRRDKIDAVRMAYNEWKGGQNQQTAAECFGVSERDVRDYADFVEGRSRFAEIEHEGTRKAYQMLLDQAYDVFVDTVARYSFTQVITDQSRLFGVDSRPVVELWDVDPCFWPQHYRGLK